MQLTHEHQELKRNLKRFIDDEINPHVDEWEAAEQFPAHEVFRKLGRLGLLGLTKPEAYGGAGLDYSYAVVMAETLGHIHCGAIPMAGWWPTCSMVRALFEACGARAWTLRAPGC